ncbi:RelE-like cytotoxic translational repressor of toxin-antitoxin stability system [Paramagnetospirillum caucaseum]|jgi:mRNA-degrading endonuclease RelE of RelBE toxin-antitoxin system|uniref:RelE-like cytotoxic translational repressor of toxin-antitoxin stability system n=1 Tax=Paramagnetospirillum caucaseum TaxID=1244869 RepID=M2Y4C4_9PROT|nr:type II toxin-antitoxin system RelE/ParE family toxin [Paramagnetospirillum caucaseum]EME67941.1 RelE-like cytotoxic translational repressor of toxin-antitoxin stability system [Paramagnetospirillum caucaseum]
MMLDKLITVVEAPAFSRRAEKLLSADEHKEVIDHLAANPDEGDEIPGTGGIRKIRFAAKGKGKSGGVRVIYYYYDDNNPLYALVIYGKGERSDLKPDEKKAVTAFAARVKALAKKGD